MKNILPIMIAILLILSSLLAVGLYNYFVVGENKTLSDIQKFKNK